MNVYDDRGAPIMVVITNNYYSIPICAPRLEVLKKLLRSHCTQRAGVLRELLVTSFFTSFPSFSFPFFRSLPSFLSFFVFFFSFYLLFLSYLKCFPNHCNYRAPKNHPNTARIDHKIFKNRQNFSRT